MKNKTQPPRQEPLETKAAENAADKESPALKGMEAIKSGGTFPIYAVIMCAGASVGHLFGTYVFEDLTTCTSLGMGVGILAAFLYSRKRKS